VSSHGGTLKRDFSLDLFSETFGVAYVGKHGPRKPFRKCSNVSASLQIRFQPTKKGTDSWVVVVERGFANPRHDQGPVSQAARLKMY
jgi:hypothetical protein